MRTIAIISQKGGSGKTTIAVHLAVCAAMRRRRVALIDLDPQRSAAGWNDSRSAERKLDAVAADSRQLAALLVKAEAAGVDMVIIDTAPHSDEAAALAAAASDLVVIPCRPARFDLDAIASTIAITTAARKPVAVVINAAPRGRLADEARATLERQGIRVIGAYLHHRVAYSHAVIDGRSVHEFEPDGAAAQEIDELYHHITGFLGNRTRKGASA
jgi:chromosome partitioning protein